MAQYSIDLRSTVIEADSQEEAEELALRKLENNDVEYKIDQVVKIGEA